MLKEYIEKWDKLEGEKPSNEKEFISAFIEFMKARDSDYYEFEGDNGYCGCTAIIWDENPNYCMGRSMYFEFAYGKDFVKVFNGNHNGFWVPEYINLKGDDAKEILGILKFELIRWAGFAC
jgi:hypothetical protein